MTDCLSQHDLRHEQPRQLNPRLRYRRRSGGNISEIMWTRIYLYQVQINLVFFPTATREEAEQLIAWTAAFELQTGIACSFQAVRSAPRRGLFRQTAAVQLPGARS